MLPWVQTSKQGLLIPVVWVMDVWRPKLLLSFTSLYVTYSVSSGSSLVMGVAGLAHWYSESSGTGTDRGTMEMISVSFPLLPWASRCITDNCPCFRASFTSLPPSIPLLSIPVPLYFTCFQPVHERKARITRVISFPFNTELTISWHELRKTLTSILKLTLVKSCSDGAPQSCRLHYTSISAFNIYEGPFGVQHLARGHSGMGWDLSRRPSGWRTTPQPQPPTDVSCELLRPTCGSSDALYICVMLA